MKTAIFDLETFSLYADTGILLCAAVKEFDSSEEPEVIRADQFSTWETRRSDTRQTVRATMKALEKYDMFVAHNGQFFDKTMLTSWALQMGMKPWLRFSKFIDPVMLARRHMRLSRRSLGNLLQFLGIKEEKTSILWKFWMRAALDGDRRSMNYIVEHCVIDILALEKAYAKVKPLVKEINERGSAF